MGQQQSSVENSLQQQNDLIQKIHQIAQELGNQYTIQFLNPDFCNQVALIFNDKLLQYRKQELNNVSYSLGVVSDVPSTKQKVCQAIIKHYTDRLNLIAGIQYSLSYVSDRIFALTTGPRCDGNPEIFDREQCVLSGGQWNNYIVMPDRNISENQTWFTHLQNMQNTYLSNLKQLLAIINELKDFDADINDERLQSLGEQTRSIIKAMHADAYQMYRLLLTTKTYTPEDLKLIKEQKQIQEQEAAAKLAALRTSNDLPASNEMPVS